MEEALDLRYDCKGELLNQGENYQAKSLMSLFDINQPTFQQEETINEMVRKLNEIGNGAI